MSGAKFIKSAIKKPGALHKELGVPKGEKIPKAKVEAAAKKPGKLGQRARFAETLEGMNGKNQKPKATKPEKTKTDRGNFILK